MKIEDLEILFDWANDPLVRANSFSTKSITIDEHRNWFRTKLSTCPFWYVFELGHLPIGMIRFDKVDQNKTFLLNYLLTPDARGRGFGRKIISMGIDEIKNSIHESIKVIGIVKNGNLASRKTFLSLGFYESLHDPLSYSYEITLH